MSMLQLAGLRRSMSAGYSDVQYVVMWMFEMAYFRCH